jgi:hypothetical protein
MFQSCGNSSSDVRRRRRPTGPTRSSVAIDQLVRDSGA